MSKQVIIMIGPSGSGKSYKALEIQKKNKELQIVSRDKIRNMFERTYSLNGLDFENIINSIEENLVKNLVKKEISFIWDNMNLTKASIEDCVKLIRKIDSEYSIDLEIMDVSLAECKERNSKRIVGKISEDILENQFDKYKKNFNHYWEALDIENKFEKYIPNIQTPEAIIVDLDGTLAHPNGRGWFDYKDIIFDLVDKEVARTLFLYKEKGFKILIVTARENKTFDGPIYNCINTLELTERWLKENKIHYDEIFIRDEFDIRKDNEVKLDLFNQKIRNNFNVQLVLEDRSLVVELWRNLRIKCYQTQEGNY